jgi:hypothetical protein
MVSVWELPYRDPEKIRENAKMAGKMKMFLHLGLEIDDGEVSLRNSQICVVCGGLGGGVADRWGFGYV